MDGKTVRMLEEEIEESLTRIFREWKGGELPLLPSERTVHLMAKAAVTVYESAVENDHQSEKPRK